MAIIIAKIVMTSFGNDNDKQIEDEEEDAISVPRIRVNPWINRYKIKNIVVQAGRRGNHVWNKHEHEKYQKSIRKE